MKAGASQVVITPASGSELTGFVAREQTSVGVHDDLWARALCLEAEDIGERGAGIEDLRSTEADGGLGPVVGAPDRAPTRLLWLHADVIGFDHATACEVRNAVATATGVPIDRVMLSATHTHAGPPTLFLRGCGRVDPAYMGDLKSRLIDVARAAVAGLQPATLHIAEGKCEIACDRRGRGPLTHVDPTLGVLAFRRPNGLSIAVLANYAVHPLGLGPGNRLISADLFGVASEMVSKGLSGAPVVLVTNGGCANLNPVEISATFEAADRLGRELGGRVLALAREAPRSTDGVLDGRSLMLTLPLEVLSAAGVEEAYARARGGFGRGVSRAAEAIDDWRGDTLAALTRGDVETSTPCEIQALRIGPVRFGAISAEIFSCMGPELRERCGPRVYVASYANGNLGYLSPRAIYAEGGYEPDVAARFYGRFGVAPGGHETVRDQLATMLAAVGAHS